MKSKYTVHYSLLLVLLAHAGVLGAVLFAPDSPAPLVIEPPTIQGMIVASEPVVKPPEPVPPPPEPKPLPKPPPHSKTPLPKAPPSERAIKDEAQPEPAPQVEPQKVAEPVSTPSMPLTVIPPRADASQLNNPAPVYPAISRRLREEGVVLLEILVKADGSLGEMHLKKSSDSDRLDDAALRAVRNWHFLPAKRGEEAIDFWYELPIEFSLNH